MSQNKSILICRCCERGLVDVDEVLRLVPKEQTVVLDDLCRSAIQGGLIFQYGYTEIHACHPRAVRALFEFAGRRLGGEVEIVNHRTPSLPHPRTPSPDTKPPAWYPVIDYTRCTACGQCHDFCLFGVYTRDDEGKVMVASPENCKNNCPACARICPETALIFPKAGESPIDGAEISDEDERRANVRVNVDEILGDDIYAALNARKQKRRSLLNQKKIEKALEERKRCLNRE